MKLPRCASCGDTLAGCSRVVIETVHGVKVGFHVDKPECSAAIRDLNTRWPDRWPRAMLRELDARGPGRVLGNKSARAWLAGDGEPSSSPDPISELTGRKA